MNKILKKPYEISLWKEVPMYVIKEDNSEPRITNTLPIEGTYILLNEFKEEICEAVIGSNTMSTPIKAFNSKFTQQLNGTNSLSFDILYKYLDERTGEYKKNPFTNLLVNERIVKLKYDEEWFFFVIKGIQENSSNFTFNYTCNDLYINELSKTGYNIELNTELRNNQGTIINLAEFILEDSDWKVDNESELIKQKNKESLYTYKIEENEGMESFVMDDFTFNIFKYPEMKSLIDGALSNTNNLDKFVDNGVEYLVKKGFVYTVQQNETIFITYSSIANKENPIQFFYYPPCVDSNTAADDYMVDSIDGIILNSPNWMVSVDEAFFDKELKITTTLFGEKLVSMQESKYIVEIDNICSVYEKDEEEYYCLRKTEYSSVTEITNLLSNNSNFITLNGWNSVPATAGANSSVILSYINSGNSVEKTLKVNFGDSGKVINSGIYDNRKATNGFIKGEEYIFAVKAKSVNNITGAKIATPTKDFFNFYKDTTRANIPNTLDDYTIFKATCSESLSYTDLLELDVDFYLEGQGTVDLINVKLHKLITGADGKVVIPDLEDSINSIIKFRNYFFKRSLIDHEARQTIFSESDLTYTAALYDDVLASSGFEPVFSERYENIRSISMEKSNRFNLIQELCETFECWAQFNIECDNTGKILYSYDITNDGFPQEGKTYYLGNGTSDIDFKIALAENFNGEEDALEFKSALVYYEKNYNKTILFKEFIGEDNPVGFRYGINVQSIKRDIKSDQITTKLIVEPNANEFAENGSCRIQTSVLNPTGETFLYNFDYYIRQRLISEEALYKDLYGDGIGLYPKLKKLNTLNINDINELVLIKTTIDRLKSRKTTYENLIIAAEEQVEEADKEILKALNNPIKEEASAKVSSSEGRLTLSLNGNTVNWSMSNLEHPFNTNFYIKAGISSNGVARPSSSVSSISVTNAPAENSSRSTSGSFTISTSQAGRFWYYGYGQTKDSNYWPVDRGSIVVTGETESLNTDYIDRWTTIRNEALNIIENYKDILYNTIELFNQYVKRMESLDIILAKREKQTASLIKEFYKRYSRFIQEGVWTSEDYIDSELYYLDAQKVLYTSSSPQISYSIDVVELSQLEKFKPYSFKVGDKTYIEDTEFFGWDIETDMPYQEEIIVSEVTFSLDNPSQNSIKVQNYKTQFEDLFQRIAATTQSLQYAEGKYKRAASAINSDGTIKSSLLENSLEQNSLILQNAANQSVTWDETGITISDEVNPNEIVRLVSGGIVLTVDGGKKWTTGITGKGINANVITTGRLDTDKIRVFAGGSPSFEWDGMDGISAYMFGYPGEPIDRGRFVRFNKYGLFGFNGDTTTEFNTITDVIDNSEFSLTWRGLKINIQDKTSATEVININDGNFLVRGDGSIVANEGYFKGEIIATSGTFEGIVKAQEFQIKDEYGNYVNILDDSKINSKYLDLGNIKLDGETGDIELVGNINFSGGNITWGQTNSPVQYKFAPLKTTPDELWSDTMRETDKFRKDSLNGGESWGAPYQFRGEDGEDGEPGSNGSDANVNFTNVNNILKNYFGIDGGTTAINNSSMYSPKIYAGKIYAGEGLGYTEMTSAGLKILDAGGNEKAILYLNDNSLGSYAAPALKLGTDQPAYFEKIYASGKHQAWVGNGTMSTGIRMDFSGGLLYKRENGVETPIGSGGTGTTIAVFG